MKLNIYLLYWNFQQNPCLNIKKHAQINIWPLCSWGPRVSAQRAHAFRRHCVSPHSDITPAICRKIAFQFTADYKFMAF